MARSAGRARTNLPLPWLDRGGRVSQLRIGLLAVLLTPLAWLIWRAVADELGPEPLNEAMHETGRWALRFLLLALAVTPAGRALEWPALLQLRRLAGLGALAWALLHLVLYAADQNWVLWRVVLEIASRFYLALGFVALVGLAVLGWTSTDGWMRHLGRGWKRLHRLVFPITLLALLHAFIQAKSDPSPAVFLTGLFLWLVAWRFLPATRRASPVMLVLLALGATAAAMGLEFLWYALATKLPAARVFAANFDASQFAWGFGGPRPAVAAGLVLLAAALLVAGRRALAQGTLARPRGGV